MNTAGKHINYVELPDPGRLLMIEPLNYNNPYNFKELHRHDYFEVIFVNKGQGSQLIDFDNYQMKSGDIFIIYPGQVHLMFRDTAEGILLQFRKDIFEYIHPLKHYSFYNKASHLHCDISVFKHLLELSDKMKEVVAAQSNSIGMMRHKAFSYLQIILITLLEQQEQKISLDKEHQLLSQFLTRISEHVRDLKKVSEYAELLHCTPDKINVACKATLDKTAHEVIHEELLLEIRRLMLLNELSLKEIAYELNFDTQGNFNAFIKSKTDLTPKELQQSVQDIYK